MSKKTAVGCTVVLIALVGVVVAIVLRIRHADEKAAAESVAEVTSLVKSAQETTPARTPVDPSTPIDARYDVDLAFHTLYEIDASARSSRSLQECLTTIVHADTRGLPKDVLDYRDAMLDLLVDVAAARRAVDDQDAVWNTYRAVMIGIGAANAVSVKGSFGVSSVQIGDGEAREAALHAWRESLDQREHVLARSRELEGRILRLADTGRDVLHRVIDDWRRLCLVRDAAYLAFAAGDYSRSVQLADQALELSPRDREARLLRALARLEIPDAPLASDAAPSDSLDGLLHDNPEWAGPALLVRGLEQLKRGHIDAAVADLELASTRYSPDGASIADYVDPYQARRFLKRSASGQVISGLYESLMLGAGAFSPELQLARLEHRRGETESARRRVQDHFFRRRSQGRWNHILRDVQFCESELGSTFANVLPEHSFVDLEIVRNTAGIDSWQTSITNRSHVDLHNLRLVLCLRFVDMHPKDYVAWPVGATIPKLAAGGRVVVDSDIGNIDVNGEELDQELVVEPVRGVVTCDEGTFRCDSIPLKHAGRDLAALESPALVRGATASVAGVLARLREQRDRISIVASEAAIGQRLAVRLPRCVLDMGPVFELRHDEGKLDERDFECSSTTMDEFVEASFWAIGLHSKKNLALHLRCVGGSIVCALRRDGSTWTVASIEQQQP